MPDRTTFFLGVIFAALLLIIYFMPSPPQPAQPKVDQQALEKVSRFHEMMQKYVKSMGEMEERLQKIETAVANLNARSKQDKPQSSMKGLEKQTLEKAFKGTIRRDDFCFDSVERGLGGAIDIWECHGQGGNQLFKVRDGKIRHKRWCLSVKNLLAGENLVLQACNDNTFSQEWQYHDHMLQAGESNFCLENKGGKGPVTLAVCDDKVIAQQWKFEKGY